MHERVAVIKHNPLAVFVTIVIIRFDAPLFKEVVADIVGNCTHLHCGCAFTDYKIGSCGGFNPG